MGFDPVNWTPRVAAGGHADDGTNSMYDLPGGTQIDLSVLLADIEVDKAIINQIVSVYNVRSSAYTIAFPFILYTHVPIAPITVDQEINLAYIIALRTAIDAIRQAEGFTAYGSHPVILTGDEIKSHHVAHLRRALRFSGTVTLNKEVFNLATMPAHYFEEFSYYRADSPYGTLVGGSEVLYNGEGNVAPGKYWDNAASKMLRTRTFWMIPIPPSWTQAPVSAQFVQNADYYHLLESPDMRVYVGTTSFYPLTIAQAQNLANFTPNLIQSFTGPITSEPVFNVLQTIVIPPANVLAKVGQMLCLLFGQVYEITQTGVASDTSIKRSGAALSGVTTMQIDFGG